MSKRIRAKHNRKQTPRDAQMSTLMRQIKSANPMMSQHQVLSTASKQLSNRRMASGLYLEPYPRGRGR